MDSPTRRTTALAVALTTAFLLPAISPAQICGDATGDTKVNIADVKYVVRYLYGGGPPPVSFFDADSDNHELLSISDPFRLWRWMFGGASPPKCGPENPPLDATLNSTFILEHTPFAPANSTTLELTLSLENPDTVSAFSLPLRVRVGNEIPQIDTAFLFPNAFRDYSVDSSSGIIAVGAAGVKSDMILPGKTDIVTISLSFSPSPGHREISLEWVTLSPIQAPTPDSSLYPLLILANGNTLFPVIPDCCRTPGDADFSGTTNIADVTFLIARIFASGPGPACQNQADANADNKINISDVTFLIARVFAGGPAPQCGNAGI